MAGSKPLSRRNAIPLVPEAGVKKHNPVCFVEAAKPRPERWTSQSDLLVRVVEKTQSGISQSNDAMLIFSYSTEVSGQGSFGASGTSESYFLIHP